MIPAWWRLACNPHVGALIMFARHRIATFVISTVASLVVVGALLRVAAGPAFTAALGRVGLVPVLVIALGWLVLLVTQTWRYRASLQIVAPRSFGELVLLRALGNALNAWLPARAGDVARIDLLSRRSGATRRAIVGAEMVDNVIDLMGWLPALLLVTLVGRPPPGLARFVPWVIAGSVLAIAFLALLQRVPRVPSFLEPVKHGLTVHGTGRVLLRALLLGPPRWIVEAVTILIAARTAGIALDASGAFAALTALSFAYIVPIPANAGTIELSLAGALTAMGVEAGAAMTFAVAYHVGQLVPMTVLGVIAVLRLRPRSEEPKDADTDQAAREEAERSERLAVQGERPGG